MESDLEEEEILHGREVDLVFRGIALVYTPDRHLGTESITYPFSLNLHSGV